MKAFMRVLKDKFSGLRQWANRDDGHFYQAGNRELGLTETLFLLALVVMLVLWQVHEKLGL